MSPKLQSVIKIAIRELRTCYTKNGIIAGRHHFTDYWARDGYFAALGATVIGDHAIVGKMISLFYKYQRADGLIPYRILRGPVILKKYFGYPSLYQKPRPTYNLRGIGKEVLDGTTLTVLFTALRGLKNWPQAKKYLTHIKKALRYLQFREKNGLLFDGVMAEWNDSTFKWGNLLYSNIIYWYMYDRLSKWVKKFDYNWFNKLHYRKIIIAREIRNKLWTGKFFADWYDYKRHDYFYPFANCLAIAWGFTTKIESASILNHCKKIKIAFTLETNYPKYPWWRIDILHRMIGMSDYQNQSLLWWQPVICYLAALIKTNKKSEIEKVIDVITQKIIIDKTIFECYERSGIPVKRFIYTSEHPFAWSSGMLIWALKLNQKTRY
ncbi:hypothetical protein A2W14_05245 [Candidatus Gottesmanbacteria bacterium RBG_16_37_8]|uniref:Uncharacterized protein n=1 Tax=Candidatus Gottesmanbacteria bacterium RBG_16_37_8 TaxID=1798371 RepID=A0A1F5YS79_9BACT|nr:MAG: hypothetical protein A2W14_05245 [Candidatus Gottesmanbacteria bacterium RBG_16_37_8]